MTRPILVALIAALTLGGAAGGYVAGRVSRIPRGGQAVFLPGDAYCNNFGSRVECQSGDAYP